MGTRLIATGKECASESHYLRPNKAVVNKRNPYQFNRKILGSSRTQKYQSTRALDVQRLLLWLLQLNFIFLSYSHRVTFNHLFELRRINPILLLMSLTLVILPHQAGICFLSSMKWWCCFTKFSNLPVSIRRNSISGKICTHPFHLRASYSSAV